MQTHNQTNGHSQLVNGAIAMKATTKDFKKVTEAKLVPLTPKQRALWKKVTAWREQEAKNECFNQKWVNSLWNATENQLVYWYYASLEEARRRKIQTLRHVLLWDTCLVIWPSDCVDLENFKGVKLYEIMSSGLIGIPTPKQIANIKKHGVDPIDLLGKPSKSAEFLIKKLEPELTKERNRNTRMFTAVIGHRKAEIAVGHAKDDGMIKSIRAVRKQFKDQSLGATLHFKVKIMAGVYDKKMQNAFKQIKKVWPGIQDYIDETYGRKSNAN